MRGSPLKYLPLPRLTEEWAVQSGEPIALVLRRICDWAICDGFPSGTFIYQTGEQLQTIDLYLSCAVELNEAPYGTYSPRWGRDLLERTLAMGEGVLAFCSDTRTVPPSSLDSSLSKFKRAFSSPLHTSPPPREGAENWAHQILQGQSAVGLINTLKDFFPAGGDKADPSVVNPIYEAARDRWERYFAMAEHAAENSGDLGLRNEINELKRRWEAVASTSNCVVVPSNSPAQPQSKKRPRGRPPGSGSLADADLLIIKRMHDDIMKTGGSITSAAQKFANEAPGVSTWESKVSRLRKRYTEVNPET
jgi:hypothetical protein